MEDNTRFSLIAPWSLAPEKALAESRSSGDGLDDAEAMARRTTYGPNEFRKSRTETPAGIFLKQFKNPLVFILILAMAIAMLLGEWIDVVVIVLAILVNTGLGFFQEYRAEKTLEELTLYIKERSRVIRGGREREIDSSDIVPGDILSLSYGARVPADARLLSANNLLADEAVLTGESLPVRKNADILSEGAALPERTNMVFAGTLITEGHAKALVWKTGQSTELGRIAELVLSTKRPDTPLQAGLKRFSWTVFIILFFVIIGIFLLGVSRGESVLDMLLLSSAVFVGAVPEALPIALTVILAAGLSRLAKRKGVLRTLGAAETLGSATVVMTDKTGTLTEARMRLVGIVPLENMHEGADIPALGESLPEEEKEVLMAALANIDVIEETPLPGETEPRYIGRPLEANIALAAKRRGIDPKTAARELVMPFNSTNKFSVSRAHDKNALIVLGAPDILLERSTLGKDAYLRAERFIEEASGRGMRLVGVARTHDKTKHGETVTEKSVAGLSFLGVLALHDPVRAEVPEAVRTIESHGARLVMITGDLKGTALAVAREIGWNVDEGSALTGSELRQLSDEEILPNLERIRVFARVTPEDKLRIGMLYKKLGKVVAMTGDGVNDAPSLKAVDIGIALGSGSDVAKSAADLVLLDDNFKTIVAAIEEGRRILANIRKVFVYLMSNSLDEVILVGGSLLFNLPLPLTALQIIWVNFFTGSLPALSFAFDRDYDSGTGRRVARGIFNREVTWLTAGVGVLTSLLLFVLYATLLSRGMAVPEARSILFVCFASYILVAAFCFRSLHRSILSYPAFENRFLNISIIFASLLLTATFAVPAVRRIFDLAPLPALTAWFLPVWLVFNIALVESAKFAFRKFGPKN